MRDAAPPVTPAAAAPTASALSDVVGAAGAELAEDAADWALATGLDAQENDLADECKDITEGNLHRQSARASRDRNGSAGGSGGRRGGAGSAEARGVVTSLDGDLYLRRCMMS